MLVLVPLVVSCANLRTVSRPVCTAQNREVLMEIMTGAAEECAPALAAWERENARNCGWIEAGDWEDGDVDPR